MDTASIFFIFSYYFKKNFHSVTRANRIPPVFPTALPTELSKELLCAALNCVLSTLCALKTLWTRGTNKKYLVCRQLSCEKYLHIWCLKNEKQYTYFTFVFSFANIANHIMFHTTECTSNFIVCYNRRHKRNHSYSTVERFLHFRFRYGAMRLQPRKYLCFCKLSC